MSVGLLIELRIKGEYLERFLHATRLYGHYTRSEPGRPRVEVSQVEGSPGAFIIRETFGTEAARQAHCDSVHAKEWLTIVTPFLHEQPRWRRVSLVLREPPPLPRTPVLEAATSTHSPAARLHLPRLQVAAERIEIARASDGFLRGAPEPCIVVACYWLNDGDALPLGRALYRFGLDGPAPAAIAPRERILDLPMPIERFPVRLYALLLSFEENGGSDIRNAYQDLADPASFVVWSSRHSEPDPAHIAQHASALGPNQGDRVQVLRDGELPDRSQWDDCWVGAASGVIELAGLAEQRILRYHTRSDDGRNDWLTELSFRFAE
jgi:quinol monooxygenase YgiN